MTQGAPAVCNRAVPVRLFYICKYRKAGLPSPSRLRRATTRVAAPSIRFVLKKHLRLAGHCPNNDSLFPPLAAVIIVAPKGRGYGLTVTFLALPLRKDFPGRGKMSRKRQKGESVTEGD